MKKALLVVGMHRSGTSALAGALSILGVDVGRDLLPARIGENDLGFFELKEVHSFHERLLLSGGRTWDSPWPLTTSWLDRFATPSFKAELASLLNRNFETSGLWGVKDPRLCQLLPMWRRVLSDLAVEVAVIHIVREPAAVAASLGKRDGFSSDKSGALWLDHNLAAERDSRGLRRAFLTYGDLIEKKMAGLEHLATELKIVWPKATASTESDIETFLTRDLDHARDPASEQKREFGRWTDSVSELRQLFHELSETGGSFDGASERFDQLRAQRNVLVAGFDPILLDHCTHLVLGSGGLRDLQQDVSLAKDTIAEAEVYAKRVEEALKATKGQEERAKKFVASLRKDLTAHRRHSEEFKSYAGDLESSLEEKEALIRELEERQRRQKERIDQLELAIHEGVAYTKSSESEIERLRIQEKEVASHTQMLESDIEKHRILEKEVKGYVRDLEAQLAEHKTQQLESARYIQSLLSQLGEPGTQLPDLDAVPGPPAGGRIRGSQAPSDRD
ncbi:MAG: hypothetical protein WBO74_10085 [Thermoanaerobaculia bacterium]